MFDKIFPLDTEPKREFFWAGLGISAMSLYIIAGLFFGPSIIMYFFALVLVFLATAMRPQAGLYTILICTMVFERHFTLAPLNIGSLAYKVYPLDFCIFFLFLGVAARFIEGKIKWRPEALDWFILIFGAAASLSFASSYWRGLNMALAFGTYKNYFLYAIIYFLCSFILINKDDWMRLLRWLVAGGCVVFFFLIYGLIAGHGLWSEYTPLSTSGERLIAGTHIFYLTMLAFWLIGIFLFNEKSCDKKEKCNKRCAIPSMIGVSFVGLALAVSLVRHLWLAVAFTILFWLFFLPSIRRRLHLLTFVVVSVGVAAVMFFAYINIGKLIHGQASGQTIANPVEVLAERTDIENITSGHDTSFRWRLSTWKVGYSAWITHPILGLGLGYEISGYDNNWPFHIAMREIHNDYLAMLYQFGIIGFIAVIEWLVYLVYRFFLERDILLSGDWQYGRLVFSFWSVILLLLVGFSISVYWDVNFFGIWWWLALAAMRFLWLKRPVKKVVYDNCL